MGVFEGVRSFIFYILFSLRDTQKDALFCLSCSYNKRKQAEVKVDGLVRHLYMDVNISIYITIIFYEKRKYGSLFVLFQILCLCLLNCGCIEDFVKVAIFLPFREYTFRDKKIQ